MMNKIAKLKCFRILIDATKAKLAKANDAKPWVFQFG